MANGGESLRNSWQLSRDWNDGRLAQEIHTTYLEILGEILSGLTPVTSDWTLFFGPMSRHFILGFFPYRK